MVMTIYMDLAEKILYTEATEEILFMVVTVETFLMGESKVMEFMGAMEVITLLEDLAPTIFLQGRVQIQYTVDLAQIS